MAIFVKWGKRHTPEQQSSPMAKQYYREFYEGFVIFFNS